MLVITLIRMPCGCVVDVESDGSDGIPSMGVRRNEEFGVAECGWCGAVCGDEELLDWLDAGGLLSAQSVWFSRVGPLLFRLGAQVVEYVDDCDDCGAQLVRPLGTMGRPGEHKYHAVLSNKEPLRD